MNLQKKEYNEGYDRTEFYSIMGKFFAEKKYRDEMPYLINTEEKEWRLFYEEGVLAGFYGHEEKKELTIISGVYVIHESRHSEVCAFMVEDMLLSFPAIRMTTSNPRLLTILRRNDFRQLSRRGCYLTMERVTPCQENVTITGQRSGTIINLAEDSTQLRIQKEPVWTSTT